MEFKPKQLFFVVGFGKQFDVIQNGEKSHFFQIRIKRNVSYYKATGLEILHGINKMRLILFSVDY